MFFKNLLTTLKMSYRMLKNAITKPFRALWFKLRRATNLGRQLTKAIPGVTKGLTKLKIKPEKREDYIDAGPVFVAKSFVIVVIIVLIAIFLAVYYIAWPLIQSHYLTARLCVTEQKTENYSGRVRLYSDDGKTILIFDGRLEKGLKTGSGKEYYENGNIKYEGQYLEGKYSGDGVLFDESNRKIYEGSFAEGLYNGKGTLYLDGLKHIEGDFVSGNPEGIISEYKDGRLYYKGGYESGVYEGQGKLYYEDGKNVKYSGEFSAGEFSGKGSEFYQNGSIRYKGGFSLGDYSGEGVEYYENDVVKYQGGFSLGLYSGDGKLYFETGALRYAGSFAQGQYEGNGKLYDEEGTLLYDGAFLSGLYDGDGKIIISGTEYIIGTFTKGQLTGTAEIYRNGFLYYSGGFSDGVMSGKGVYFNPKGDVIFEGTFIGGIIDPATVIGISVDEARAMFGAARTTDYELDDGLLIVNNDIDITFFVSYQTEDADPAVYRLYQCTSEDFGKKLTSDFVPSAGFESDTSKTVTTPEIKHVDMLDGQKRFCRRLVYKDYSLTLWSDNESSPVTMATMVSTSPTPTGGIPPSVLAEQKEEETEPGEVTETPTNTETPAPAAETPSEVPAASPDAAEASASPSENAA